MNVNKYSGICVDAKTKLVDRQALWNTGVRFVVADAFKTNDCLDSVYNDCLYMGFDFGVFVRLRYPPEEGSSMSQADWLWEKVKNYKMTMPVTLFLEKGPEVLCETNQYRGMIEKFFEYWKSYSGDVPLILKAKKHIIDWIAPNPFMLTKQLWIKESTSALNFLPWPGYVLRSYGHRFVDGTYAEWVEFPGPKTAFVRWAKDGVAPVIGVTPSTPPAPTTKTDHEILVRLDKLMDRLETK